MLCFEVNSSLLSSSRGTEGHCEAGPDGDGVNGKDGSILPVAAGSVSS